MPVVLRGTVVVLVLVAWLAAGCGDSDCGLVTANDEQHTVAMLEAVLPLLEPLQALVEHRWCSSWRLRRVNVRLR